LSLSEISARFFLQLALGLIGCLLFVDRRSVGAGFTRLISGCALLAVLPGIALSLSTSFQFSTLLAMVFALLCLILLSSAGRSPAFELGLIVLTTGGGALSVLLLLFRQVPAPSAPVQGLFAAAGLNSALNLGLVVGAMLLGHWYLVTPELPVRHLGRMTRCALCSLYLKLALLGLTSAIFVDHFRAPMQAFATLLGLGDPGPGTGFQSQLDFIFLLARITIGLVGPAILCHMTLAAVRLHATQPATGILYATTVMVLMGEFLGFYAERSLSLVL